MEQLRGIVPLYAEAEDVSVDKLLQRRVVGNSGAVVRSYETCPSLSFLFCPASAVGSGQLCPCASKP